VKYCFFSLLYGGLALAQSSGTHSDSVVYTTDLNGHVVADSQQVARDGSKALLVQSINGREVPLQSSETHVLTDEPNHRVTETIVRTYDATGQLGSTERTVSDEVKGPAGSVVHASVFRSDLNGHMNESERRVIDTHVQGSTTTADVTISRAGVNGSLDTAEKRQVVTIKDGDTVRATETIQRPSGNGNQFFEAAREVREETKSGDKTTSSTAMYELDFQGKLSLSRQDVRTTAKAADGSQVTELNTYAPSTYTEPRTEGGSPKLREQEMIVRRENNGVVTETTTVRRPTPADPNRLGDATVISNLVCTGTCGGSLQAAAKKP
jgi:hypothetical protein